MNSSARELRRAAADAKSRADRGAGDAVVACPLAKHWIEIVLMGEDDVGVPDVAYEVRLPDGSTRRGKLDARGVARVQRIGEGACVVSFPDLDRETWGQVEG